MIDDGWRPDPAMSTRHKIWAIIERHGTNGIAEIGPAFIAKLTGVTPANIADMCQKMMASGELVKIAHGTAGKSATWKLGKFRPAPAIVRWSKDMDHLVETMWKAGRPDKKIAAVLGIGETVVSNRREKLGFLQRKTPTVQYVIRPESMQAPIIFPILPESIDLGTALAWAWDNKIPGNPPGIAAINAARKAYGLTPWLIRHSAARAEPFPSLGQERVLTPEQAMGRANARKKKDDDLPVSEPPEVRFWRMVRRNGDHECWPYTNTGAIAVGDKKRSMRWYSWLLAHGEVPSPARRWVQFRVTCGHPKCVNPRHMLIVGHAEPVTEAAD